MQKIGKIMAQFMVFVTSTMTKTDRDIGMIAFFCFIVFAAKRLNLSGSINSYR